MAKRGAIMRAVKYREILRLWFAGFNDSEIAQSCGCSRATVQDYRGRAAAAELTAEILLKASDSELLGLLGKKKHRGHSKKALDLNWDWVATELRRPGVTLFLLWQEKVEESGYSYSSFCRQFRLWEKLHDISLRQVHNPGEKSFVDYSGLRIPYYDRVSGDLNYAEIFVGILGASNLTYVEASESQKIECWLGSHVRMFSYVGGVTGAIVPDNLKSGVTKACKYEPDINRTYLEFAEHYGTAILPARSRKPKDKAKVEKAVQDIQRSILAPLRDCTFCSVAEINLAIKPLLEAFNARPLREYKISRLELFNKIERQTLKALPALPFEYASWKQAKVNIDYHIEVGRHYYSVPYYLVRKSVEVRISEKLIEIFFDGKRVAFHQKSQIPYQHTTLFEHMPPEHQAVRSWSKDRFIAWSQGVGSETSEFVLMLFNKKAHPEQSFRSVLGLQRLAKQYGSVRLENSCKRANHFKLNTMRSVRTILETGKDKIALKTENPRQAPLWHVNLRGENTFH